MNRIIVTAWIALLNIGINNNLQAQSMQANLDNLINKVDPKINMGISVIDLNTGESVYKKNSNQSFIPASNMKLFSNATALLALGPDFKFISKLKTSAKTLNKGTLKGNVYIELPGDPSFTKHDLNNLLASLKAWHINKIDGDIVIVNPYKTMNLYAPGVMQKDLNFSYGAPISPLIIDENHITITVNPATHAEKPAIIEYDAPKNSFTIQNKIKTVNDYKHCGIDLKIDENNQLIVNGCIGAHQQSYQQKIAIRSPIHYAKALIHDQLQHLSISLAGQVNLGNSPKESLLLATHNSAPLTHLLADTLKPSDNLYADRLYLQAASKIANKPADWESAPNIIKSFLAHETNINLQNANFLDGSGLSRHDNVTPEQTVQLLYYLATRFPLAYEYISALPISGYDGTLQKRLTHPFQRGFVRAKTGTMHGVISLSGYLYTANGHTLIFAMYINTRAGTPYSVSGQYRHLIDSLCDALMHYSPINHTAIGLTKAHTPINFRSQKDSLRYKYATWRRLELELKKSLKQQPVAVLFRPHTLLILDYSENSKNIWSLLESLAKKHAFSVALKSNEYPLYASNSSPFVLWIKESPIYPIKRTWKLIRNEN